VAHIATGARFYPNNYPHISKSFSKPGSSSGSINPGLSFGSSSSSNRLRGPIANKFGRISIDNILSDVSEIPSAQQRRSLPPQPFSARGAAAGKRLPRLPKRITQTIPPRSTKLSEKLVLIPEDTQPSFRLEDDEDDLRPPPPLQQQEQQEDSNRYNSGQKTYAERMPKDRRTDKFSRLTAYCVSDAIRIVATAKYLRDHHKILPRIYHEALYAPYYLPLLSGDDDSRVQSSPGGVQLMERFIDQSEQVDHHYEYYSGLDTNSESNKNGENGIHNNDINGHNHHNDSGGSREDNQLNNGINISNGNDDDFDPSEPQDFTPPRLTYLHDRRHEMKISPGAGLDEVNIEGEPKDCTSKKGENSPSAGAAAATKQVLKTPDLSKHAEIFIFTYGVIVFWNFTEQQEKDVLADLNFARTKTELSRAVSSNPSDSSDSLDFSTAEASESSLPTSLIVRPIPEQDIELEELHFTYSPHTIKPRIYNDMVTLKSGDHMIKLAMSHAIAQSTKLSRFEARMDGTMHDVRHVPKTLALKGKLGLKREEILKVSGRLFKLRVDVNLSSNILDTPEFFWEDEPSLNPLYTAVREYLEIEQRILVLNERCKVFLDLTEIIADSIAEYNMSRITWIIIILIALSLTVSIFEIVVRFHIIKE
jgi:uncharacterized Rmd1/YagE family protein